MMMMMIYNNFHVQAVNVDIFAFFSQYHTK